MNQTHKRKVVIVLINKVITKSRASISDLGAVLSVL